MLLFDGRPNGELLLSTGSVEANNPSDFINMNASLVQADRYYSMKAQILETLGMGPKEAFPVYADRMPIQLFSYLRLARVSDPALFAKVRLSLYCSTFWSRVSCGVMPSANGNSQSTAH